MVFTSVGVLVLGVRVGFLLLGSRLGFSRSLAFHGLRWAVAVKGAPASRRFAMGIRPPLTSPSQRNCSLGRGSGGLQGPDSFRSWLRSVADQRCLRAGSSLGPVALSTCVACGPVHPLIWSRCFAYLRFLGS